MSYREESRRAFTAGVDIDSYLLVTLAAGVLALCDPGEKPLGVTEYPALAGEKVNVRLLNTDGTVELMASGVVAVGDELEVGANGTVLTTDGAGARTIIGMAVSSVSAGGVIEVIPYGYGHNLS